MVDSVEPAELLTTGPHADMVYVQVGVVHVVVECELDIDP